MRASRTMVVGAAAAWGLASAAQGQITGSDHDFSSQGWSQGQICLPCHTTHNTDTSVQNAPLWNHELTVSSYTVYGGATGVVRDEALDPFSILCMSCHDGTVALDSFGGSTGSSFMGGSELLGTDLSDDHPIGITAQYPDTGMSGFNLPATWESGGYSRVKMPDPGGGPDLDVVSCATCHTVHNDGNINKLLRVSNAGSAMCLDCHIK